MLPVENERELAVGGFQGIKKIRGLLVSINVEDPPENWENREKQVVAVKLEDCAVLEMFGDEEIFELRDGKFSFFITYAKEGNKPHQASIYSKCWLASARELGKVPSEFIGKYITLEKQPRLLFQKPLMEDDGTGKKVVVLDEEGAKILEDVLAVDKDGRPNHFCFVADETVDSPAVKEHVRTLLLKDGGLNEKAALRALLTDTKAKQFPTYKDALNAGTLAEELGLKVVDGKFTEGS